MKLPKSILTKDQKKHGYKEWTKGGNKYRMTVTIRYDDECNNGHNSFSITGNIKENGREYMGGCIHQEIIKHFPGLKKYIKWHLCSSDGPMYYVGNTMYHARKKTHADKELGEPVDWDKRFKFTNYPFTFKEHSKGFWEYLESVGDFNNIFIEEIKYVGDKAELFSPNYSLTGFIKENVIERDKWYEAPFKNKSDAEEFLLALKSSPFEYVQIPIKWCEPVQSDIDAARHCAIWPNATLEQLNNEQLLLKRLPKLMEEFKSDVEELGFIY